MKTYSCPKCGRQVPLKDINIAKDIMLCSSCGEISSVSAMVERDRAADEEDAGRRLLSAPPPKHLKVESDPTDMSGRLRLVYRKFSKQAIFLVPFTCVWAGFSMSAIYGSQIVKHAFDLKLSLFGLPFLLGSIALVSTCLFMIFGKHMLTLARGSGSYFVGVGPIGRTRRFTFDRRTCVETGCTGYEINRRHLPELRLTRPGDSNTIHICAGMSEDALAYGEAIIRFLI